MSTPNIFVANDLFVKKVSALKKRLRTRMNGATTEQMEQLNSGYAINYGAQLPHIRQLAQECEFAPAECRQLWQLRIRETMLLAAMLSPDLGASDAAVWAAEVSTPDMAEQASHFLFYRTQEFGSFAAKLIESRANYAFAVLCFAAGHRLMRGLPIDDETLSDVLCEISERVGFSSAEGRGVSLFLRQLVRKGLQESLLFEVVEHLSTFADGEEARIFDEVKGEIDFAKGKR